MSIFPFKDPLCDSMQRDLVAFIGTSVFVFELPSLSDASWNRICNDHRERERLEFLGDALISASISGELFRCRPQETPGFYTKARSVLTANSTFAHLMHKLRFHDLNDPVKPAGDAYETILAAFHGERGPVDFGEYVRRFFTPLIHTVGHTYHKWHSVARHIRRQKRQALLMKQQSPRVTSAQRKEHRNRLLLKTKRAKFNSQITPARLTVPALPALGSSSFVAVTPRIRKQIVIDLTFDSDEEEHQKPGQTHQILKPKGFMHTTSPTPTAGPMRSPPPLCSKSSDTFESHAILQSISLSPQVSGLRKRKILNNGSVKASELSGLALGALALGSQRCGDEDNLAPLLKPTSIVPLRELGTVDMPITID